MSKCLVTEVTSTELNRCMSVKQLLETQFQLNNNLQMGPAWIYDLSAAHFKTAIVGELGEILDQSSSPNYKWWKKKDPSTYSETMTKLEIIDIVHFYLSVSILNIKSYNHDTTENLFNDFEKYYVGSDRGNVFFGINLVDAPNELNHENYMNLVNKLLFTSWSYWTWVDILDYLVSSMGINSEELAALYTAKAALNSVRWEHPDWQKVSVDGVEDNERLFPLVDEFLENGSMSLVDLKNSVLSEFFTQ